MLRRDKISSKYPLFLPRRKKIPGKTLRRDRIQKKHLQNVSASFLTLSGYSDSNGGPPAPKAGALANCATSRKRMQRYGKNFLKTK